MDKELAARLNKVFANTKANRLLIANTDSQDPNFKYLTRFRSGLFERDMLIASKNSLKLFTSELEYETALAQRLEGMQVIKAPREEAKRKAMLKKEIAGKVVGINANFMPTATYLRIKKEYKPKKIIDASEAFSKARLEKSKEEIKNIEKAAKITLKALTKIPQYFKEGITEKELARIFDSISAELGSEKPSFDTIVSFGKNAALPHHMPDSTKLRNGDLVVVDAGAVVNGYCSDMTRTFVFGKDERLEKEREMINVVKEAQRLAINAMKEGRKGSDVDKAARSYIDTYANGKYKGTFIHSLGHSVGIEVHDGFALSPGSNVVLKRGMVFTAEPGIYVVGFGGVRIEDDVLITEKGPILLGRGELG